MKMPRKTQCDTSSVRDNRCLKQVNIFQLHARNRESWKQRKIAAICVRQLFLFFRHTHTRIIQRNDTRRNGVVACAEAFRTNRLCRIHYFDFIAFVAFIIHWLLGREKMRCEWQMGGGEYKNTTIQWLKSYKLVTAISRYIRNRYVA